MTHPVLTVRRRLFAYLFVWFLGGLLIGLLLASAGDLPVAEAFAIAVPLVLLYAFVCLAAWYPSRTTPLSSARIWQAVSTHAVAAVLSSAIWQLLGGVWAFVLSRLPWWPDADERFREQIPLLFVLGLLLYLLAAAASYLAIAFERSRLAEVRAREAEKTQALAARELELARSLQQRLLPPSSRRGAGFRLEARNLAAQVVAGDFYDYFRLPDGSLAIAIADVSGKGMAAGLIMASVKAVLPLMAAERSVTACVQALNHKLQQELSDRSFVALALVRYDPEAGIVEMANAGLPNAYVLRHDGRVEEPVVPQPRLPLGLRRDVAYQSVRIELAPADRLLLLTDGLPEALTPDGDVFGYEALAASLVFAEADPAGWLDRWIGTLRAATRDELTDDWTAVLLERPA